MQIYNSSNKNNQEQQQQTKIKVIEGIQVLLSHFEGRQPLFPRKMSTALSKGKQFTLYSKEQILNECIKSNFIDCRLNAYPVFDNDDEDDALFIHDHNRAYNHIEDTNSSQVPSSRIFSSPAPNIIFIDVDFRNDTNQKQQLNRILNIIKKNLNGFSPTVLWTGNGYHIYIVLDTRPLELITDLKKLSREPSKEFLRFAEINFTNGRADSKHNPSFRSYLLRIPFTLNSKCIADGTDPEVKIIKKFDVNNIPKIDTKLLREFRLYLADLDIKIKAERRSERRQQQNTHYGFPTNSIPKSYLWIDNKLLQTAIPDHRKYTLELVLAPYLINIKHLSAGYAYSLIKHWTSKCNALTRLEPSAEYFL